MSTQWKNYNLFKMDLQVNYLGMLVDFSHCSQETINFSGKNSKDLIKQLEIKHPLLKGATYRIAQNQMIISETDSITANEVVLLPPFSGG